MNSQVIKHKNALDIFLLVLFSAITPYAYLWLKAYLIIYFPIQNIYKLLPNQDDWLIIAASLLADIVQALIAAFLLVTPFGYLVSTKRAGILIIFCIAVLFQVHFYPFPIMFSIFMATEYLSLTVFMAAAFFLGYRLKQHRAAKTGSR